MSEYSKIIVRIGMSFVFLWFGLNQIFYTSNWTGYIPDIALKTGFSAYNLVFINGIFEVVFATMLLIGLFTRISALVLGIHLIGISFSLGYNAIAIRDIGLALATLSIFFAGKDKLCIDNKISKK